MGRLNKLRRLFGRADVLLTAAALLLYLMGLSWGFTALSVPIDGITNVIIKLFTGNFSEITWINNSTPVELTFSIAYWLLFVILISLIAMVLWNIKDFLKGKEEPSPEIKAINELRKELSIKLKVLNVAANKMNRLKDSKIKQKKTG